MERPSLWSVGFPIGSPRTPRAASNMPCTLTLSRLINPWSFNLLKPITRLSDPLHTQTNQHPPFHTTSFPNRPTTPMPTSYHLPAPPIHQSLNPAPPSLSPFPPTNPSNPPISISISISPTSSPTYKNPRFSHPILLSLSLCTGGTR